MTGSIAPATAAADASGARATLTKNFDTFLTLLTAQLQNQDPLDPVDSNQFTQQLVQYSQVEQQIQTNDTLKSLITQQQTATAGAALGYLGRTAEVRADVATFSDERATWFYTLDANAADVELTVRDESGRIAATLQGERAQGRHELAWDGRLPNGRTAPEGRYRLSVAARDAQEQAVEARVSVEERVTGVDLSSGEPILTTAAGSRAFDQIVRIKE